MIGVWRQVRLARASSRTPIFWLLEDLHARGLLDSTLVIATGEFGRTPEINVNAGRDHWPNVFSILLAGAGVPGGQVWGSSDADGMFVRDNPVEMWYRDTRSVSVLEGAVGV
jgi:uncharacterized protein (DUF1501 family)